jgi:hypothetical protein
MASGRARGRRLRGVWVELPAGAQVHSRRQAHLFDEDGLLRRNDYAADVVGRSAVAAHPCDDYTTVEGLALPARRTVYRRLGGGYIPFPVVLSATFTSSACALGAPRKAWILSRTAPDGAPPGLRAAAMLRSGALFTIYMVLAYLAIAAYGRVLLQTALAPRWLARAVLIFGLVGAVDFTARVPVFAPPLMIHLPLGAVCLAILRGTRARTSPPAGRS